jgi:nitrogen-specific signal transduction histidine kinase
MLWSVSFGLIALVRSPELRFAITNFFIIAVPLSAISTFIFCYEFTFKKKVPRGVFVLFIPVVLMFIFSWFNPYNLIYTMENPYHTAEILVPANEGSIRPIINVGMGFLLVIMSAGMVLGEWMNSSQKVRKTQALFILISIATSSILGMIKVLDLVPPYFDPTPIGWTLSGVLFAISIKRYQFLQLSPAAQNQAMNEVQDIVILLNPENAVADANCAAIETLNIAVGMSKEELQDQIPELTVPSDKSPQTVEIETHGAKRIFDKQCSTLEYGHGAEGSIIILRDITELTNKERELQQKNERLDEFVNEVTHDLRSPLTVATGYLELTRREVGPMESLDKVEDAHQRMDQLIEDVLAKARGNQDLTQESLSITECARTAWSNVATGTASLEIEADRTLEANSGQLLQLFENFFGNSIEHGGDDVTVRLGYTDTGFFVADNGHGIPEQNRENIFDREVTYSDQGTGYGLAIVSDIVNEHGWVVSVRESDNGGARFDVTGGCHRKRHTRRRRMLELCLRAPASCKRRLLSTSSSM